MGVLAVSLGPTFDAAQIKKANGWLTWFWISNLPPVIALYLVLDSEAFQAFCLLYLAIVSIWANIASHAAGWVAGRIEVKEEKRG